MDVQIQQIPGEWRLVDGIQPVKDDEVVEVGFGNPWTAIFGVALYAKEVNWSDSFYRYWRRPKN